MGFSLWTTTLPFLTPWTMMTPLFVDDRLLFFPVTRAHQGDTGGAVPGGYNPGATDIWQEGLRLPPIKIYERGRPRADIIKMLEINNRAWASVSP